MNQHLRTALRWHAPLMWFAAAMAVVAAVSVVGYVVDDRVVVGAPIWAKPLQFSISFAIYAVTLAWLVSRLQRTRVQTVARRTATVIAVATGLEMAAILLQVLRGRQSHFNYSTPFDAAVFGAMGGFVVVIFLATVAVAVAYLLEPARTDRALTWAVRLGLGLSLAGMSVGFLMLRPTPGQGRDAPVRGAHAVGVADGGSGLPLLGWSTTGGDLRVPHFVGLHALQVLPLLALTLTAVPVVAHLARRTRLRLVVTGGCTYAGAFALALWQALRGQPVTAPDVWTLLALVGLVAAAAVATVLAWVSDPDQHPGPADGGLRGAPVTVAERPGVVDPQH